MRAVDPDREAFYWHGVGRAAYFLPASSLPRAGAMLHAVTICRREPPDAATRLDALAGLAFAVTMINWHQPWLIERLLRLLVEEPAAAGEAGTAGGLWAADGAAGESAEPGEVAAFASGVAACVIARRITIPAAALPPLLAYVPPDAAGGRRVELWEGRVRRPCLAVLAQLYPQLAARGQVACFARFQRLGPLLAAGQV
jgi:hypothetical protein